MHIRISRTNYENTIFQQGNYRLALSVELAEEEGDHLVHQLAGLDIVESPDRAETPRLWEEGAEPGPEYDDNQDL